MLGIHDFFLVLPSAKFAPWASLSSPLGPGSVGPELVL